MYSKFFIEEVSRLGVAKVVFNRNLNLDLINTNQLNMTSLYKFELRQNQLYKQKQEELGRNVDRNLKISNFYLERVGMNYLSFQL